MDTVGSKFAANALVKSRAKRHDGQHGRRRSLSISHAERAHSQQLKHQTTTAADEQEAQIEDRNQLLRHLGLYEFATQEEFPLHLAKAIMRKSAEEAMELLAVSRRIVGQAIMRDPVW